MSRTRKSIVIDPNDESRIFAALEEWGATGDFTALRTRAFVYLLRDGALRTKAAVWLNIEEVVRTPSAIRVVSEGHQRACEGNNYRERKFLLSPRSREAIADYLKVARSGGWLADESRLEGPLWIATRSQDKQRRLSQRMALHAWRTFLEGLDPALDYQLDDVVLTGRVEFLKAAGGREEVLSEHSGFSTKWAGRYREHLFSEASDTARDVMAKLAKQQKRGGG